MQKLQYSKAEERIRCMARLVGVDYSKKTLNNVKRFLEIYSAIKTSLNLIPVSSSPNIIKDEAPELFEAMIMSEEMSDDRIEHFIVALVKTGNMEDMIEQALDKVCAFGKDGKLYETILKIFCEGLSVLVRNIFKGVTNLMNQASLILSIRKSCGYSLFDS